MKGVETCEVLFDETPIPESNVLGMPGKGMEVYAQMMAFDRMFAGARVAALLRDLMKETITYLSSRRAFGKTLSEFDLVKHKLSEMAGTIYMLESMTYMTAGTK